MSGERVEVSQRDKDYLQIIRREVRDFTKQMAVQYINKSKGKVLDVAPQDHEGVLPYVVDGVTVETLDIDPESGATHIGDLCQLDGVLPSQSYDYIVCTEVLEHTLQPFAAVQEMYRLLRPEGMLFLTTPFNFRIHGPLPDCWRFTEHGLRALLKDFTLLELRGIETPERALMPIHHSVIAKKDEGETDS